VVFMNVGRGCGGQTASTAGMNMKDPAHPIVTFENSKGRPSGAWGTAGPVLGPKGLLIQTADGAWGTERGLSGNSVIQLRLKELKVTDYFTPENEKLMSQKDLDFGSASPIAFRFQNRDLIAAAGKEGTIYLIDGNSFGGEDHRTPVFSLKYGNDD